MILRVSANAAKSKRASAGSMNPLQICRHLWRQRELIRQLTSREVLLRYRGAYLGLIWSFVNPLFLLLIYTFVFSYIFHAHWDGQPEGRRGQTYFAMSLFGGLIPFTLFAEMIGRAPTLILSSPNYVRKVIFPLEVLPIVTMGSAIFHSLISAVILLAGAYAFQGSISRAIYLLPVAYVPLVLFSLGWGWILASLGTFMRDMGQGVVPLVQILTFLTPIFYPPSAVPERVRKLLMANPLTVMVQGFRESLLGQGHVIGTMPWLIWTALSVMLAWIGYVFFVQTKQGFADVV